MKRTGKGKNGSGPPHLSEHGCAPVLPSSIVTLSLCLNLCYKLTCSTLHIASLPVPPAPLKLWHYGALQMYYYFFKYPVCSRSFPSIISIQGHFTSTIQGHFTSILSVQGHFPSIISIQGHITSILSVQGHFPSTISIQGHFTSTLSVQGHFSPTISIQGHFTSVLSVLMQLFLSLLYTKVMYKVLHTLSRPSAPAGHTETETPSWKVHWSALH